MHRQEDIPKTAFIVASIDILVSLLAALMIFPIIFTFNFTPQEGPGLLFKTLPVLFNKFHGSLIISTTFFLLVVFAALTSAISVMEVLVATVTESFGWTRQKGALIVAGGVSILAVPSALSGSQGIFKNWVAIYGKTFFDTIDYFSFTWLLPINAIFTAFFVGWIIEKTLRQQGLVEGSEWVWIYKPWLFLLRWVVPVGIVLIMLQQGEIIDIDAILRGFSWAR